MNLENLNPLVDRLLSQKKEREEREKKEEKIKREIIKEIAIYEESKRPEKIELLKQILSWRNEFASRETFHKLRNLNPSFEINIYYGLWGHDFTQEIMSSWIACWSRTSIDYKISLNYNSGYKYHGINTDFPIDRSAVDKLRHSYILSLNNHISSGKVYETIEKELKI